MVDDNPEHREMTADILTMAGGEIYTASNAKEALDWARNSKVNFMITDYFLINETGDDVLSAIRSLEGYEKLPAILLTAASLNIDAETSSLYNRVLAKPIIPIELISAIRASL